MRIDADRLSNIAYCGLQRLMDEQIGYTRLEVWACDEALFLIQIKRALAERKKRIILDVKYPK